LNYTRTRFNGAIISKHETLGNYANSP